ncbi:hypothetical protein [Subtercola frigoramans]|uniref:Uncharacterized protein n=1 Tax=Subtercola frigoramans TaxID=120298 RepID=A0ABS2L5X7_9MICO|nr:hypothetical protein [Subtercola frigoramans]MBM7472472.1 hypothetical protein [Subtercola frigoramans]
MKIRRSVETVATSNADDAAYLALEDVARITEHLNDVRVVGGQMASLLLAAFPVAEAIVRRTADADAAISTSIAASGHIHRALTDAGYIDVSGNHYAKGPLEIDLLVPSGTSEFVVAEHGGRGFDAAPGLMRALATEPVLLDVGVMLTDGSRHEFLIRVPPVELAVTLKAYATTSRAAAKDLTDLYNLLGVANSYDEDDIGAWTLRGRLQGTRLDTGRILHNIADRARTSALVREAGIPQERLAALIRRLVTDPR